MTSLKDIQSLIADIDSILPKADARLPWSKPGDIAKERRVLERIRSYLAAQERNLSTGAKSPPVEAKPAQQQEMIQQLVQIVNREIDHLRADFMQPLQAEVEALLQQRDLLVREIRQLEQKRLQIDSQSQRHTVQQQILAEVSQELINRCSERLTQHLAQILANSTAGGVNIPATNYDRLGEINLSPNPSEQLRQLQEKSDQMLLTLEANQRAIFEVLQRDLQSYQESLSQGLERMHTLGTQGEMVFAALVNRLAQQLGREASMLLSPARQPSDSANSAQDSGMELSAPESLLPGDTLQAIASNLPSNSILVSPQPSSSVDPGTPPAIDLLFSDLESTQDSEMASLLSNEPDTANLASPDAHPNTLSSPSSSESLLENLTSEDWEIVEGLDSDPLSAEQANSDEIETFIQLDLTENTSQGISPDSTTEDSDLSESLASLEEITTVSPSEDEDADFLLNWLHEKQPESAPTREQISTDLNTAADLRRQEIDELYQSLFGTDSLTYTTPANESDVESEADSDFLDFLSLELEEDDEDESSTQVESVPPLSSSVEQALFEEFFDPASAPEAAQVPPLEAGDVSESWEALFYDETVPESSISPEREQPAPPSLEVSHLLSDSLSDDQPDKIETIGALTDLLEEMDFTPASPTRADNPVSPSTGETKSEVPTSDQEPEASLGEDRYIPASPDEDLLETETLISDVDVNISLNPNTLEQLQQDLSSFEQPLGHPIRQQRQNPPSIPQNPVDEPTPPPEISRLTPQEQQFLMSQELLAEDWEELNEITLRYAKALSEQDDEASAVTPTTAELAESDYDPDLFPSETLELDRENAVHAEAADSEEMAAPESLIAFEAENFIEIHWDEPAASAMEEAAISPELDANVSNQNPPDSHFDGEVNPAEFWMEQPDISSGGEPRQAESPSEALDSLQTSSDDEEFPTLQPPLESQDKSKGNLPDSEQLPPQ